MSARSELGEFLQTRRARVRPEDVGLQPGSDRRVSGLRREEVALLANVSVDYYIRLEQGRADNPSVAVLTSVADALRMDQAERDHLRSLACTTPPALPPRTVVRPQLEAMIQAMRDVPALVVDRLSNVLAWNRGAIAVIADFDDPRTRNLARQYFLEPASREFYADWEMVARDAVALLRRTSAEYGEEDAELAALVDELRAASPDFDRFWTSQDVQNRSHCPKTLNHPIAGRLSFSLESLQLPADPGQFVLTYTPADPTTQAALETLLAAQAPLSGSYEGAKRK
ncbi:helix-turn-helix transcriptional regulator [Kribbella sp. NBC_01484]|uniref:helix-turn-helix transcriptional regulator n=1 Tax=Kribbella sp. NBC_01484 TaxID=2903579 RepID=UPI002E3621D2|nr:helix-turn-helix transcriptional regulator [Kribbella sp. NBC_01484]